VLIVAYIGKIADFINKSKSVGKEDGKKVKWKRIAGVCGFTFSSWFQEEVCL